ncbi:14360_t:CDS:2 [Funneliformis geosporum]|uniref:14360_t:CDS:1 n=1 Tax=Funneliformis geosporum TaxID=1117311 RepID=A0A9W4SFS8_9GLOM|nr:14360_t:CDS:2 [Funneliformis geosporum]
MSEVEDISIKIDYDIAHNGEHITLISVSPNGKYVITYSNKDHSIEGWIVDENDSKCSPLIRDPEVTELSIKPSSLNKSFLSFYFKNDGDLVISKKHNNRISVYSHVGGGLKKKKKLSRMIDSDNVCKVMFENNKVCLIASNNLFQCDLDNFKFEFSYSLEFDEKDVEKIIMRENLILLKYNEKNNEKISIYLKEIHFPIRNIQVESNVSIRILSNNYFITFNLTKEDEKQDLSLHHTTDINKQPVDRSRIFNDENDFILFEYNSESQRAFGFVEESVSSIKLTRFIWHELFATNHGDDEIIVGWNTYLHQTSETQCNDTMVYPDMENIRALVSNQDKTEDDEPIDINFNNQKYKWRIDQKNKKLSIFKLSSDTNGELCSTKLKEFKEFELVGIHWRILNNNALAQTMRKDCRLEHRCIIIYKYNIINKDIKMHYFYFDENFTIEKLSGTRLPIMNFEAFFKHNEHFLREWLENIIEDDRCLAIYGEALLPKFINEKSSNYIEKIYSKCTNLVKEDPKKNLKFLNIITLSMNDLYKTYPDYISKFNSEMYMILNPSDEHIISGNHFDDDLYTFNEEFPIDQSFRAKYYRVDVEMARRYIKEAIKKGDWNMEDWPEMKRKILKLLNIEDAIKRD